MPSVRTAHTSELDAATLDAVRAMLDEVFAGQINEDDWDHALGGLHALVLEDGAPIAHAALVQRRLVHGGRALRAGYVEGLGVRADRRRRGHAAALMGALEKALRGAYEVGALSATDAGAKLYAARGWERWRGPTSALTPTGVVRTPDDDGGVFVFPLAAPLDLGGELTCDWRDGDVW